MKLQYVEAAETGCSKAKTEPKVVLELAPKEFGELRAIVGQVSWQYGASWIPTIMDTDPGYKGAFPYPRSVVKNADIVPPLQLRAVGSEE